MVPEVGLLHDRVDVPAARVQPLPIEAGGESVGLAVAAIEEIAPGVRVAGKSSEVNLVRTQIEAPIAADLHTGQLLVEDAAAFIVDPRVAAKALQPDFGERLGRPVRPGVGLDALQPEILHLLDDRADVSIEERKHCGRGADGRVGGVGQIFNRVLARRRESRKNGRRLGWPGAGPGRRWRIGIRRRRFPRRGRARRRGRGTSRCGPASWAIHRRGRRNT